MAKSKSQATPNGVNITECNWKEAKPVTLGDTVWFPFPRIRTITLERDINEPRQIKVSEQNVVSFVHASFYKFGGATGDCVGSKDVPVKGPDGKKTGGTRKKTRKEITKAMDDRLQAIVDGTYVGVSKGPRGIPVPEEIAEGILFVQAKIKKGKDWGDALSRQFQSKLVTRKDVENTLALSLASYRQNNKPTPERVAKAFAYIMGEVHEIVSRRNAEWNDEDDDILA